MKKIKRINIAGICINICSGGTPKSTYSEYYGGNIPWLNTKEVNFNRIYETEKMITLEGFENSSAKWIEKNSIIVAMYGATAGKCAISKIPLTTNQACCNLTIDPQKADYRFVFYALFNDYQRLSSLANGGAQQNLNTQRIKEFDIPYPAIEKQIEIADIFSSLDDKIELNNRINDNLQQQAQAIFKSWFIDYLPFNGIKPSDWISTTLGETTEMGAGGDKPKTTSSVKSAEFPYPIYSNGLDNKGLYGYTDKAKIFDESVTVSARGTIGFVCLRHIPYVPIVRLVTLIPNKVLLSAKYLYLFLKQLHISGTGTTQQQLTVPDFRKTKILIPNKTKMDEFTKIVTPIFDKIWANEDENAQLASLRDNLLPKLMSGEIDVSSVKI